MTVPVALIATAGGLALVSAIVYAARRAQAKPVDSDMKSITDVRNAIQSEPSVNPTSVGAPSEYGSAQGSFDTVTIGGKSKRKAIKKKKTKRKHSKKA